MIFPLIEVEPMLQVADKTRISAIKSFKSIDEAAITLVEIEPEFLAGYIDITGSPINSKNWFLDWSYATAGTKNITLRITTNGSPVTFVKSLTVITSADDKLWSTDSDLQFQEPDILNWIRPGRTTFLDIHRSSQRRILEWLDNLKIWDKDGEPFDKDDITLAIAENDLKRISTYWTLETIYGGLSNQPDDVFANKERQYKSSRKELCGDRSRIRADFNKDGIQQSGEQYQIKSIRLGR